MQFTENAAALGTQDDTAKGSSSLVCLFICLLLLKQLNAPCTTRSL